MPAVRYVTPNQVVLMLSCSKHVALKIMREAGASKIGTFIRIAEDVLLAYLEQL